MDCWILKLDSLSGEQNKFHNTAFSTKEKAHLAADDMKGEWHKYDIQKVRGEIIGGNRVIVSNAVYKLDESSATEYIRQRALAKLSKSEKAALGL